MTTDRTKERRRDLRLWQKRLRNASSPVLQQIAIYHLTVIRKAMEMSDTIRVQVTASGFMDVSREGLDKAIKTFRDTWTDVCHQAGDCGERSGHGFRRIPLF